MAQKINQKQFGTKYSTSETITGDTWIDGRPIYQRGITGTVTAASGIDAFTVIATIPDLDAIVGATGWFYIGSGNLRYLIPGAGYGNRRATLTRNSNDVRFESTSDQTRTNAPFEVVIRYLKTS